MKSQYPRLGYRCWRYSRSRLRTVCPSEVCLLSQARLECFERHGSRTSEAALATTLWLSGQRAMELRSLILPSVATPWQSLSFG